MARRKKEAVNKMDMSLDDIIAMNRKTRGSGVRGRGRGGGAAQAGQKRPWTRQSQTQQAGTGVTARKQKVQELQRKARQLMLKKGMSTGRSNVLTFSGSSRWRGTSSGVRGRGWGRGRGLPGQRGGANSGGWTQAPAAIESAGVGRGRGRGMIRGRGRATRGRGAGRGRVAMAMSGPDSSPAPRLGSRLKIIRSMKGRGKTVIAIKRRLSTGSLQQQLATPTRGRGRGRGWGRGSLSVGSTPVAEPSGATPLRVSVAQQDQTFEPAGVDLSPNFAAAHHTQKSLNTRFSQSSDSHLQRLVRTDGRNVQYS